MPMPNELEKMVFIKFTISTHEVQRLCWCYEWKKPNCGIQAYFYKLKLDFPGVPDKFVPGAIKRGTRIPLNSTMLYESSLQDCTGFTTLQAAKSEHRQKARSWWLNSFPITVYKRNPTKPTKLCNNMCSPSSFLLRAMISKEEENNVEEENVRFTLVIIHQTHSFRQMGRQFDQGSEHPKDQAPGC